MHFGPMGKRMMERTTSWKRDLLPLVILISGVSLFHLRGLLPGRTFLPVDLARSTLPWGYPSPQGLQNWLISDPLYQFYPFLTNAVETVQQEGGWPLWNPSILMGHPTFADPLAQSFYPVFVGLGLILGAARALAIGLWSHVVLAALLTYGFLRVIQCRRYAAVLGGFTYALSGYLVTWFETTFWVSTLAWLPGILWAFELAVRRRSLRYTALTALTIALAILAGEFRFAVAFMLFLALYAIGRTAERLRNGNRLFAWPLVVVALAVVLGALLSAIQTVPFSEFLGLSHRVVPAGLTDPLPIRQLITLIVPDFYGNPASTGTYWGWVNFSEATVFAGVPALLLACAAPFLVRRFFVIYMFIVGVAVVYFVVGGPGVRVLGSVPVLEHLSLHRSAFLVPLLIALLSAMGLSQPRPATTPVVAIGCVLAAIVGLAILLNWGQAQDHGRELLGPVTLGGITLVGTVFLLVLRQRVPAARRWVNWGLIGLAFVNLALLGARYNPAGPIDKLTPATRAVEYLRGHAGLQRVVAYQGEQTLFGPNILSIYGIAEPGGYSSVTTARLHQLVGVGDPGLREVWVKSGFPNPVRFFRPSRRLLDLLQVGYVVSPSPLMDPGVRAEFVVDGCDGDTGEIAGEHVVSGSFVVKDLAINRLDFRFRVCQPGHAGGAVLIRMWRGVERKSSILQVFQDSAQLKDGEKLTVYFAPEKEAPGQTYVWELTPADFGSSTGVCLCTLADGQPAVSVYGVDWSQVFQARVFVFERLAPMPRAYVVYGTEYIADDDEAVNRLLDEAFDLRNVAVVADPVPLPAEPEVTASRAEIVEYRDTRVVVKASAVQTGLLVLGDQFYPGWRAYVDGQPAEIVRTNHVMRGVVLSAGDHEVVFEFAPGSLRTGICLSLAGVAGLVGLVVLDGVWRRSARER